MFSSSKWLTEQYTWLAEWFFILSTTITKFSILLFYKRVVAGTYSRRFILATRAGIYFNGASAIAFCLMLLLECRLMNAYWKAFGPDYKEPYTCSHEKYHFQFPDCSVWPRTSTQLCCPSCSFGDFNSPGRRKWRYTESSLLALWSLFRGS
jgi:hypothetical protein